MTTTDPQVPPVLALARPPKELRSSTAHLLKRFGSVIKERSAAAYEPTGFSPYHHAVLALLDEEPPETQAMIADALGYDRSHLVGLLDELEERGLIERRRDPSDRRRRTLKRLRTIAKSVDAELFAPLDPEQRETLHALLVLLANHHESRRYAGTS